MIRAALIVLCVAFLAGCGSRPGFEEDFTAMPEPEAPREVPTDEDLDDFHVDEETGPATVVYTLPVGGEETAAVGDETFELRPEPAAYRFNVGDNFEVRYINQPEMNIHMTVRPDGEASFDLIGELPVAGLTVQELTNTLEEMYAVYLRHPTINVVVREFKSRRVFVLGQVNHPGEFPLFNPISLTHALALAGSWTDNAKTDEVMVIRMREDGTPFAFKVNLKAILAGAVASDPHLVNMDIVYVPMGRIASARSFIGRLFGIILPPIDAAWKTAVLTGYKR